MSPGILNLSSGWRWVISFRPRALKPGETLHARWLGGCVAPEPVLALYRMKSLLLPGIGSGFTCRLPLAWSFLLRDSCGSHHKKRQRRRRQKTSVEECVHVEALVVSAFVILNTVTGSWPARYGTPICVLCKCKDSVNYRRTTDTVVTFGFQLKLRQFTSLS